MYCPMQERLFDVSDAYRVHVCERTGLIAVANLKKQQFSSQVYKADSTVVQVRACQGFSLSTLSFIVAYQIIHLFKEQNMGMQWASARGFP